jgi:hypothetical protein
LNGGLEFTGAFTAPSGRILDVLLQYTITAIGGTIKMDSLSMAGFGTSGSGFIDIAETAGNQSLHVFANSGGIKAFDSVTFNPGVSSLNITKDISVGGGFGASGASVSLVDNATLFEASVPEPATLSLIGVGLILAAIRKRRV